MNHHPHQKNQHEMISKHDYMERNGPAWLPVLISRTCLLFSILLTKRLNHDIRKLFTCKRCQIGSPKFIDVIFDIFKHIQVAFFVFKKFLKELLGDLVFFGRTG